MQQEGTCSNCGETNIMVYGSKMLCWDCAWDFMLEKNYGITPVQGD